MVFIGGLISLFLFMGWRRWNPKCFQPYYEEEEEK
jgi:hypothetical protein